MSDVVIPRTTTIPISRNRTITIRDELNHGQHVAMLARMYREGEEGKLRVDALRTGDALIVAYLVDWTLTDAAEQRIEIRGLKPDELQDVLNNVRHPTIVEIKKAIEAFEKTNEAAADEQKKIASTVALSPETLPSVAQPA